MLEKLTVGNEFIPRYNFTSSVSIKSLALRRTEEVKFTRRANRRGESTASCGTSDEGVKADENESGTETKRYLLDR